MTTLSTKRFDLTESGGIQEMYLPSGHYAEWTRGRQWSADEAEIKLMEDGSEYKPNASDDRHLPGSTAQPKNQTPTG